MSASEKASAAAREAAQAAGAAATMGRGPLVADQPSEPVSHPSGPTSKVENDAHLRAERAQVEARAKSDERLKRLFGMDADPKKPSFDPIAARPSKEEAERAPVAKEENTEAAEAPVEAGEAGKAEAEPLPDWLKDAEVEAGAGEEPSGSLPTHLSYIFGEEALAELTTALSPDQLEKLEERAKFHRNKASLRLQRGAEEAAAARTAGHAQGETAEAAPRPAWSERVRKIAETVGLDDEGAGELEGAIRDAVTQELTPFLRTLRGMDGFVLDAARSNQRARVGSVLPILSKHDGAWGLVQREAESLLRARDEGGKPIYTPEQAYDRAAEFVTKGEFSRARRDSATQSRARRQNGQPTSPARRQPTRTPAGPKNMDEFADNVLSMLFKGDLNGAREYGRQRPG